MPFRGWDKTTITTREGTFVEAIAPVIISASRATDIPAFYMPWFIDRLKAGYCSRPERYNRQRLRYVSFENVKAIVFWSKNPEPLLRCSAEIERRGLEWVVQYTLNDYGPEGLEPGVPDLGTRIDTFMRLADRIGPDRVIWRFDPLMLTRELTVEHLLERMANMAGKLRGYTRKLVFSFVDIERYRRVHARLAVAHPGLREFTEAEMAQFVSRLLSLNELWGFSLASCAEESRFVGIARNRCIDGELLSSTGKKSPLLAALPGVTPDLFGNMPSWDTLKDPGQRSACGCTVSVDIGGYGTCPHLCAYCYANDRNDRVLQRFRDHDSSSGSLPW